MCCGNVLDRDDNEEDDNYEHPRRRGSTAKSGAVAAVGVISIVLGSLVALLGLYASLQPYHGVPFMVGFGLLGMLFGVGFIMAGVGVVRRQPWGRILTLVLAGFTAVATLWFLDLTSHQIGYPVNPGQIFVQLVFIVLAIGYVVASYTILLNSRYAAEFRENKNGETFVADLPYRLC
jgi:hypothetical protein